MKKMIIKTGMILIGVILLSSCRFQYKHTSFKYKLGYFFGGSWRYEMMPSLTKCDESKYEFIEGFIAMYPYIDSLLIDSSCFKISNDVLIDADKIRTKQWYQNILKNLQNHYDIVADCKGRRYDKEGNKNYFHVCQLRNGRDYIVFEWLYISKNEEWILNDISASISDD